MGETSAMAVFSDKNESDRIISSSINYLYSGREMVARGRSY